MGVQRKILVVDDAALFRDLESLLRARSGHVVTAASGKEGLEVARAIRPDIAVIDLHMPGLDGAELCRGIKSDPELSEIPVILVTSVDEPRDHALAVRAGADDIIPKPINRISLIQAVNRLLHASSVPGLSRVCVDAQVRIRHESEDAWGTVRNLSRGGIYVTAARTVPPETEVELEFVLPEMREALHPTAKVIWRRDAAAGRLEGMGLRFLELDRSSAARIDEYVYTHEESLLETPRREQMGGTQ
jgi:uncharacterized protein (TIGR02266 family)